MEQEALFEITSFHIELNITPSYCEELSMETNPITAAVISSHITSVDRYTYVPLVYSRNLEINRWR